MPFINTKTTVSLSKSKKDSLTAEICRITRECLGKGENWVMTGFEDNASLFFQGDSAAVAYVEVKSFGTPSAAGTSQMTGKLCHLLSGELSIPADHIYVAYFPTDNWGWKEATSDYSRKNAGIPAFFHFLSSALIALFFSYIFTSARFLVSSIFLSYCSSKIA